MTDLEKVKRCAERLGIDFVEASMNRPEHTLRVRVGGVVSGAPYWPLTNKAQAFELVEKLELVIMRQRDRWRAAHYLGVDWGPWDADLLRAIVECVANIPRQSD